ncbi:HoxA transcriptional regulator [Halorientalis sp. IM1011]|nr:HoxA transcriptional regulator [Halorientalis sp. IM1011]
MSSATSAATVLVAEDEQHLADLYTDYLAEDYEVVTAYGGEAAVEVLRDETQSIDVALLDRRMPDLSGDKVLAEINENGCDCRVAMVTAVNPGFDIIDMGCDDYLVKPVSRADLLDVVERLLKLSEYSEKHQQLTSKKLKRNVLKVEKSTAELDRSDRFERLTGEIEGLEAELDEIGEDLSLKDVQRHI